MRTWQETEAALDLDRLVDEARHGPQMILRGTERVGVVLSPEDYARLVGHADAGFAEFLLATPMEEVDFDRGVGMGLSAGWAR